MRLSWTVLLALCVQQALGQFSNVGNVNTASLAAATGGGIGAVGPAYPGGAGVNPALGLHGHGHGIGGKLGGYSPYGGGAGYGFGQKLGFGGAGFGQKLGFGGAGFGQKLGFAGHGYGHSVGVPGYGVGPLSPGYLGGGFKGGAGILGAFGAHPGVGLLGGSLLQGLAPKIPQKKPLKLTCRNVVHAQPGYGPHAFAIAVTIMENKDKHDGYGDIDPYGFSLHGDRKESLSFDLSVKVTGLKGTAKVVFTEKANVNKGCSAKTLGSVFTGDDEERDPFKSLFGQQFFDYEDSYEEGVVTKLSVYADQPTSVHVDKLEIRRLKHLAGRGVAVVQSVKKGGYGKLELKGKVLACCALSYDDHPRSLHDTHQRPSYPPKYEEEPAYPPEYPHDPRHPPPIRVYPAEEKPREGYYPPEEPPKGYYPPEEPPKGYYPPDEPPYPTPRSPTPIHFEGDD